MLGSYRIRRRLLRYEVPSGSLGLPARRRVRLLALLAVRNQVYLLPGYVANIGPQVDGIVALDDGSTDGSAEFLEARPEVLQVLRVSPDRPYWDEVGNYRALVAAALRHDPEWLISLDADERIEREFRQRCERVIRRGRPLRYSAYAVHLRELWNSTGEFRVDGIWGSKTPARLFQARENHEFDTRPLHATKAPLQSRIAGSYPVADLNVYHLGTLHHEDRVTRRRRYELLDPENRWQPKIGYAYLTDEQGLHLRRIPAGREYSEGI
jgi:glycosyltransferase involved in cell wall biosynthesis